jgi:hypothetical protein
VNIREYQRLKLEAEAEYRRKLEAIETVWKLSGGENQSGNGQREQKVGKGDLLRAVKSAAQVLPEGFTLREVEKHIQLSDPALAARIKRPSLSSALKRLAADKQIAVVTTGIGKRASTYRKVG